MPVLAIEVEVPNIVEIELRDSESVVYEAIAVTPRSMPVVVKSSGLKPVIYQHHSVSRKLAEVQLLYFVVSFLFLYKVWWFLLFGVFVALVGRLATIYKMDLYRVKWVSRYFQLNCLLPFVAAAAFIAWFLWIRTVEMNLWMTIVFVCGMLLFVVGLAISLATIKKISDFLLELKNCPPEAVVFVPGVVV